MLLLFMVTLPFISPQFLLYAEKLVSNARRANNLIECALYSAHGRFRIVQHRISIRNFVRVYFFVARYFYCGSRYAKYSFGRGGLSPPAAQGGVFLH